MIPEIQTLLEAQIGATEPGAAVAIARRGEVVHASASGYSNLESESKIEPHTIFRVGSLTKQFIAVSMAMLEERGCLSLDESAKRFLVDAPSSYTSITLRQLLTHTAGVPNYTDIPGFWAGHSMCDVTPEEASAYFMALPLEFQPGEHFKYSNSGYVLLSRIIEGVSGKSYREFLLEQVLRPLGMDDTYYNDGAIQVQRQATGYVRTNTGFGNAPFMSMTWPLGSGGLASSAIDLIKWQSALSAGKIVNSETLHLLHRAATPNDGSRSSYGMGWMIGIHRRDRTCVHHSGSIRGFASHMAWFPADDVTIVVLSNLQSFPAVQFGERVAEAVLGG